MTLNGFALAISPLTNFERVVISTILAEEPEYVEALSQQLQSVVVEARENTGAGFFTTLSVSNPAVALSGPLGLKVYARIGGLEYGMGFLIFLDDGRMSLLEGYSFGENTSGIDFENTTFSVTSDLGP